MVLSLWGLTGPVVSRVEVFLAYHADQLSMARLTANLPDPTPTRTASERWSYRFDFENELAGGGAGLDSAVGFGGLGQG